MARSVLVYRPGHPEANHNGMVDRALAGELTDRSAHSAPHVISDTMADTRHMADGKYYDSKSKFRKVTRDHGCVEVGNEVATLTAPRPRIPIDRKQLRDDIKRATWEVKNGRRASREV